MKVVSYYNVVPVLNKSQEKYDILNFYIDGVNAQGDTGIVHKGNNIIDCDVAVIQGWQHELGKTAPHLALRQKVIDTQIARKKSVICADANLFLYANPNNKPYHYLRYSINGVFPSTGEYCDDTPEPKRWRQISRDLGITVDPYRMSGKKILICLQRDRGWSMGKEDIINWTRTTIRNIRKYSDRPIVIRPHPKDKKAPQTYLRTLNKMYANDSTISISNQSTPLAADLHKTWAVVNKNSSSIVGPIIQGYHAFITDPHTSQCAEVAHTDFKKIENPIMFDREKWLERISMFHWNFDELKSGKCWSHMKNYCQ